MRLAHLARPPGLRIVNAQRRELLGREDHGPVFVRRQLDRLLEARAGGGPGDDALHGVAGRVVQFGVDGQVGRVERAVCESG